MIGIVSWAQATSITIVPSGSVISGPYSYIYDETVTPGTSVASASISFNNIELTANGPAGIPNTLFYDLINGNYASKTISSGETLTDYFQTTSPYDAKGISDQLGYETLTLDKTISWTYTFSGQALTDLQNDFEKGYFDIGLDPNCVYDIGSIDLNYTPTTVKTVPTPDTATTVSLLGMSFLGLVALRRKFAF